MHENLSGVLNVPTLFLSFYSNFRWVLYAYLEETIVIDFLDSDSRMLVLCKYESSDPCIDYKSDL